MKYSAPTQNQPKLTRAGKKNPAAPYVAVITLCKSFLRVVLALRSVMPRTEQGCLVSEGTATGSEGGCGTVELS